MEKKDDIQLFFLPWKKKCNNCIIFKEYVLEYMVHKNVEKAIVTLVKVYPHALAYTPVATSFAASQCQLFSVETPLESMGGENGCRAGDK